MVFRGIHWTNLSWPFRVIGNYFLKMYKYIPSLKYYEKCAVKSSVTFDWIVQIYYYTHYFSILSPVWMGFGIFPEFHFYFFPVISESTIQKITKTSAKRTNPNFQYLLKTKKILVNLKSKNAMSVYFMMTLFNHFIVA